MVQLMGIKMSENKRFTMNEDGYIWEDMNPISQETVLNRLNKFYEENQLLKEFIELNHLDMSEFLKKKELEKIILEICEGCIYLGQKECDKSYYYRKKYVLTMSIKGGICPKKVRNMKWGEDAE